jgi:hypothetical protein
VTVGDRLDDGKSESDAISGGAWVRAKALKGLEQAVDLARWNHGAGVRDRQDCAARGGMRSEIDSAMGNVVTDGVFDQVCHEALDQFWVAERRGRLEGCDAPERVRLVGSHDIGGGRGEVDGLASQLPVLAAGEGEERLEQLFLALAAGDDALAHVSQGGGVGVGVRERDARDRELKRDLASQFVSGVGGEAIHGSVPGDEAGHDGLRDEAVGNADARVARLQHRGLIQVDTGVGDHLVGDLAVDGRVGEAGKAMAPDAAGERHECAFMRPSLRVGLV